MTKDEIKAKVAAKVKGSGFDNMAYSRGLIFGMLEVYRQMGYLELYEDLTMGLQLIEELGV